MLSGVSTPEQSTGAPSPATAPKPLRVLACVLCQQRKVKCDRRFPCANCTKAGVQCVSAALAPKQRRRRFPERELLDRLRHYEHLLRKNNIAFDPLHATAPHQPSEKDDERALGAPDDGAAGVGASSRESTAASVPQYRAKSFWHAMNRKAQNPDNDDSDESNEDEDYSINSPYLLRQVEVKYAWDQLFDGSDHLLFCVRNTSVELSLIHPTPGHIFKLWQVYLENVNPLLKVTHTPTLQTRIIDAASNVTSINPNLEALMFSIYCVSVFSLDQEQCLSMFGTPRQDILKGYQLGAREALLNCAFLRSSDRDCLTALHLYLITIKPDTDPRSLTSMLGLALRIAQRMGIHSETINTKHPALEAELRRRLWWSLVLFDARISEMTEFKLGMLLPTWDCKVPLNVNDFDLRPEMKNPPAMHGQSSEALFAVVRSEYGDFVRHSSFHLDFINPALKSVARQPSSDVTSDASELAALEKAFENRYLKTCDPDNPLHFMTIWIARGYLAKIRFVQHLSVCSRGTEQQADAQRNAGIAHALAMLDCDTRLMKSPLTKGFRWLIYLNFPFPAYVHLVRDLKERPLGCHAERAWKAMSDNCSARFNTMEMEDKDNPIERKENPFFKIFAGVVLQAWAAREAVSGNAGQPEVPPLIISQVRQRMARMEIQSQSRATELQNRALGSSSNDLPTPESMDFNVFGSLYNIGGSNVMSTSPGPFPTGPAQAPVGYDGNQWGWPTASWNPMLGHGW